MKGYGDLFIMNLAGCWGFAMTMFHGLFFQISIPFVRTEQCVSTELAFIMKISLNSRNFISY